MDKKLILIVLLAFVLRLYGINWDNGFHLHPDERMIAMVASQIHFFDKLNPHFFNYGSLPVYLLKGISQFFGSATYEGMLLIGRTMSILFDLGTVFLIYQIALILFKKRNVVLFSSFLYAITFFPIQNAHFFTVDIMFSFLTTLLLYQLLLYIKKQTSRLIFTLAITFAALFATKFTAVIFLPVVLFVIYIKKGFSSIIYYLGSSILFLFLFMPYAIFDFSKFLADVSLQLRMNKDPYIFPYTLQYVGTTPYFYYLKNIFLWGLGPLMSILALFGLKFLSVSWRTKFQIIFLSFYLFYFLIIGISAVKFMRYMLSLYPFFALMAGYGLYKIFNSQFLIFKLFITGLIAWSLLFINMYSKPNTRITATEWILKNIPRGSSLAVEYWDDYLPIYNTDRYFFNELHLYDLPDDGNKWKLLGDQLQKSEYIIIASNRLYAPLQKLASYPKTTEYYKRLFGGQLGFKKVAEFSVRPGIQIGSFKFELNDDSADESFTVFDHPKVMIFRKI